MHIKLKILMLLGMLLPSITLADHGHPHLFHAFTLETDAGQSHDDSIVTWDLDGWIGNDYHKLWLKTEGERVDSTTESAEFWALYSRNIAEFWDAQIGLRHDTQPDSTSYAVLGFSGLAPYFFETGAHLFVSDEADVSARLRQENDFFITQRLIAQPYFEVEFYAQDVPEQAVGAGLATGEFGIQLRYEITRHFAPYFDLSYERKFGEASAIAQNAGEHRDAVIANLGLRLMF